MTLVGAAMAALPLAGRAQQASGPRKVGVLFTGMLGADRERLINEGLANELGSQKSVLFARSSAGDNQMLGKYAAELATGVDVIFAIGSGSLVAAREASQSIPIVALDLEADPIAIGAAQSLNRPGGNVTGILLDAPEIAGKWIQIIRMRWSNLFALSYSSGAAPYRMRNIPLNMRWYRMLLCQSASGQRRPPKSENDGLGHRAISASEPGLGPISPRRPVAKCLGSPIERGASSRDTTCGGASSSLSSVV